MYHARGPGLMWATVTLGSGGQDEWWWESFTLKGEGSVSVSRERGKGISPRGRERQGAS